MRNILILLAVLCGSSVFAVDNILGNADFRSRSSADLPFKWHIRGGADGICFNGDFITVGKANEDMWLIQYLPENIEKGKKYEFSCVVSGKGQFRPYVEWQYLVDGNKKMRSSGAKLRDLSGEAKKWKVVFTLAENALRPYAVINVPKGNEVTISDLKLVPFVEPLLLNADFSACDYGILPGKA